MRLLPILLLLAACPSLDDEPADDPTPAPAAPEDPLELAAEASLEEIEASILDLEGMGTRNTFTPGNQEAIDYLVGRLGELGYLAELDPFEALNAQTANVIARKPGVVTPERVWIYSAHYDSTSDQPDTYAPGADDNASGVAGVLEAARILADRDLEETVWFVFTGAEEQGSLGSAHMSEWLLEEDVDVQGVIAPDMIGYWPLGDEDLVDILGDDESEHLVEAMASVAAALDIAHKTWIQHGYCYGDDHTNFQEAGFPSITPMDCVEAHNIPSSGETTPHYHRISDTIDTLHLPFTTEVVGLIVATLADLAVLDQSDESNP